MPISVQRIYRNQRLISDILLRLSALWKRVIAPEIIEMLLPIDLNPFVTSSSFLTDAPHNANVSMATAMSLIYRTMTLLVYPMATAMSLISLMITLLIHPMATVTSLIYTVATVIMYPMSMVIIAVVCLI